MERLYLPITPPAAPPPGDQCSSVYGEVVFLIQATSVPMEKRGLSSGSGDAGCDEPPGAENQTLVL